MKKNYSKYLLPLLLMLVLSLNFMQSSLIISADDTENIFTSDTPASTTTGAPFQPADGYVLAFDSGDTDPYAYFSPFVPTLTYNGSNIDGYSILFGLKNTYTGEIYENAYCTDMPVDAVSSNYQRLNLSDSSYAAAYADKLRAIVLKSYPHTDLDTLRNTSGIADLSMCEAITGTQLAIWKTAHGDIVQIDNFLSFTTDSSSNGAVQSELKAYQKGNSDYKTAVKSRIEALYNYLMSLPGQSASATVLSSAAFLDHSSSPVVIANDDGTYNITVTTTVNIPSGSDVALTAYVGNGYWYAQQGLNSGSSTCTLTISNVPAEHAFDSVILSIDGTQSVGEDVFLLDSKGIRGTSQSMIAPLSGAMPVHAETKAEPDRILEIYKTSDGTPLGNISFEVYYVGTLESFLDGSLGIGTSPSASDLQKYARTERLVGTITTDANGYGELNFHSADAVYLVKELPNDLVTDSVSFFLTLPDYSRCDENGNPAYTITTYPKNTLRKEKIEIEKDVTTLDNEHDTFDIGENHTWIIQSSIPYSIASGRQYQVSDTLDNRLSLQSIDKVALAKDSGTFGDSEAPSYEKDENETPLGDESLILTENIDYTIVTGTTDDGCDTFTVSLSPSGIQHIASAVGDDYADYELRIYFTSQINTNASPGEDIPNQAQVEYVNNLYKSYTSISDSPEVHTGGIQLLKIDGNTSIPLAGAVFSVYREADSEDLASGTAYEEMQIGDTVRKMIPVAFYDDPTFEGDKVSSFTTNESGYGYIYGLAYGDYYLIETQAPEGYNSLHEAQKFTISASSHSEDSKITVVNTAGVELPSTGGTGTGIYTVSGLLLISIAVFLFLSTKKQLLR